MDGGPPHDDMNVDELAREERIASPLSGHSVIAAPSPFAVILGYFRAETEALEIEMERVRERRL